MQVLMVGMALDTNGQKARFVDAARRWGDHPDVVRALIAGNADLAGVAVRYAIAADKLGSISIRSAHKAAAYFDFPEDIRWTRGNELEVRKLAQEADLIHLTNDVKAYFQLRLGKSRKPAVLHHHGTLFRNNPARMLSEARRFGMVQAVSTIDLLRPSPDELHWLPTAYDLDDMAAIRAEHRRPEDGRLVIASAPTNREIKSTEALEAAVRQLQAEGLPVDLLLIEGRTWTECLRQKATADIYFDQVKLGYGCNAIEAWGMGIPVVAGADDWTLDRMRQVLGKLPFHVATETTIAERLRELVEDAKLRKAVATAGQRHAERFHSEKAAVERLAAVYALALSQPVAPHHQFEEFMVGPGVFRTEHARLRVNILNQTYVFSDGELRIENPQLAQRMRRIARYQPEHQITEVFA